MKENWSKTSVKKKKKSGSPKKKWNQEVKKKMKQANNLFAYSKKNKYELIFYTQLWDFLI